MITPNWDMLWWFLLFWYGASALGSIFLGLLEVERDTHYGAGNVLVGIILLVIILIIGLA